MAVLQMDKIRLLVHRSKGTEVLRALQRFGMVELTQVTADDDLTPEMKTTFEFNYVSSRIDYAVDYLTQFADEPGGLQAMIEGGKRQLSYAAMEKEVHSFYFNDVVEKVQDTEAKLNDAKAKVQELEDEAVLLRPWKKLDYSLSHGLETRLTKSLAILTSAETLEAITKELGEQNIDVATEEVDFKHYLLTVFKDDVEEVVKLIADKDADIIDLPRRRGTPAEELERIDRALVVAREKIDRRVNRLKELSTYLPKLRVASDYFRWKKNKHNYITSTVGTDAVLVFEGWVPTKKRQELEDHVNETTPLYLIEEVELAEGEEPPVELENKLARPFETVTRLYGLPGHTDLDPTPFLASFFIIFFALSLTDVGYGLMLTAVTSFVLWRYNVPAETKPAIQLMLVGGIMTSLIGLLFGGYLGIPVTVFPEWIQKLQQFDPVASPLPVLFLSLALGVVQIVFGLILKIFRDIKQGDTLNGILDKGPWLFFFAAMGYFIAVQVGAAAESTIAAPLVYASLIGLVITQGRNEPTLVKKFTSGVFSLYDIVAYFADILSYSRILALGLATSALAFAVNLIAGLMRDLIPFVGPVVFVVILIVGHLFNLAVNLLGAFVHSARLQFVEFFGKFLTGSGRAFKPFRRDGRFVIIK